VQFPLPYTRSELLRRGIALSETFHDAGGIFHHAGGEHLVSGPNPQRKSYAAYLSFSDPDGDSWVFQEVTARLTGHKQIVEIESVRGLIRKSYKWSQVCN
jgi:hypothetical protein